MSCPRHRCTRPIDPLVRLRATGAAEPRSRHEIFSMSVLAGIGIFLAVAAAGVGAYMQYQQGQYMAASARYNAAAQAQAANMAFQQAKAQAAYLEQTAALEASMFGMEAENATRMFEMQARLAGETAEANVALLKNQSRVQEEIERTKFNRAQSSAEATVAGLGIRTEGSPMIVMLDNVGEFELDMQRLRYGTELEASAMRFQGSAEAATAMAEGRIQATRALANAEMTRANAMRQATALRDQGYLLSIGGGQQAAMTLASGSQARTASYLGAGTTLLGGVGSGLSIYGNYRSYSGGGGGTGGGGIRYYMGGR